MLRGDNGDTVVGWANFCPCGFFLFSAFRLLSPVVCLLALASFIPISAKPGNFFQKVLDLFNNLTYHIYRLACRGVAKDEAGGSHSMAQRGDNCVPVTND